MADSSVAMSFKWITGFILIAVRSSMLGCGHETLENRSYDASSVSSELEELKTKAAFLEFVLQEKTNELNTKDAYIANTLKIIEEKTNDILFLQKSLDDLKHVRADLSNLEERVSGLETEVGILKIVIQKSKADLQSLEYRASDMEKKSELMASQIERMEDIVTEQWIQIRQTEHALQTVQMMTLKARRKIDTAERIVLKFINKVAGYSLDSIIPGSFRYYILREILIFSSYVDWAAHQLKGIIIATRAYHHELQLYVKKVMEKNQLTKKIASNDEVVFFLASMLIVVPIMGAWMLYSSTFE
ncbi:hypothetical protein AMTRI_Chr01g135580 [Amborella trichopoda]